MGVKSGRPEPGEYASYAQSDIDAVGGDDAVTALRSQVDETLAVFQRVDDGNAGSVIYAPGKWTLKQMIHHLSDDERIFAYRCLCLARNDSQALPGFDEKHYEQYSESNQRTLDELLNELCLVRSATIALLNGLSAEAWMRRGIVNSYSATVRGLAFHIAGHELHHMRIVRDKYLCRLSREDAKDR